MAKVVLDGAGSGTVWAQQLVDLVHNRINPPMCDHAMNDSCGTGNAGALGG
jgi:hypothetical protein